MTRETIVIIYFTVLTILWIVIRIVIQSTTNVEPFSSIDDYAKLKTFGTLLRNIPEVEEKAKKIPTLPIEQFSFPTLERNPNLEALKKKLVHVERFDTVDANGNVKTKYKSFGTLLKNHSDVDKLSSKFKTIHMKGPSFQLPKSFDGRVAWKDYLSPVNDQKACGNCWAHSSCSVLADRFAIMSLGQVRFKPSPAEITVCSKDFTLPNQSIESIWGNVDSLKKMDDFLHKDRACNGNTLYDTAQVLYTEGITDEDCFPATNTDPKYNVPDVEDPKQLPYCYTLEGKTFDMCIDKKTPMKRYRSQTVYNLQNNELAIMNEIYRLGPVVTGFLIFPDFMYSYDGKSIYAHSDTKGDNLGGHAVAIYGWGTDNVGGVDIPYWIIKNSWGSDWGENGFFKIKRGLKECIMEDNAMAMIPDFTGMTITQISIIPVESAEEIAIKNYTNHSLNSNYGYYENILKDVADCKLTSDKKIFPYLTKRFSLPDYNTFIAGKILEYLSSNSVNPIDFAPQEEIKCGTNLKTVGEGVTREEPQGSGTRGSHAPMIALDMIYCLSVVIGVIGIYGLKGNNEV
jgi:hypothetical protein